MSAFGANEWLVDEMYEKYQQDPDSVDKVWWEFFRDNGDAPSGNGAAKAPPVAQQPAPAPAAPKQQAQTAKQQQSPAAPAKQQQSPAPAAKQQPAVEKREAPTGQTARKASPVPKEPERKEPVEASDEPSYTVLRGAPARTVQNMDASLTLPTATSVRSVPV
jgi:2-oxoglutarate dehydrogenase E1 component